MVGQSPHPNWGQVNRESLWEESIDEPRPHQSVSGFPDVKIQANASPMSVVAGEYLLDAYKKLQRVRSFHKLCSVYLSRYRDYNSALSIAQEWVDYCKYQGNRKDLQKAERVLSQLLEYWRLMGRESKLEFGHFLRPLRQPDHVYHGFTGGGRGLLHDPGVDRVCR